MKAVIGRVHTCTTAILQPSLTTQLTGSLRTDLARFAHGPTATTMLIIRVGIDAFTRTVGEPGLTGQLTLTVGANPTGDTRCSTGTTVGVVGFYIDACSSAVGQSRLTA